MALLCKNACVYLFNKHGYVMLLKCRASGLWMTPGGKIEENIDDTPFAGMMREFQEETNVHFPVHNSKVVDFYRWKDTMVYVVMMNHRFPSVFEKTNETVAMRFVHFSKLDTMHNLKRYVGKAFRELNIGGVITRRLTR